MVDQISGGGLSREAILAALRSQAEQISKVREQAADIASQTTDEVAQPEARNFADALSEGVEGVDSKLKEAASVPEKMLTGEIQDFHEIAVHLRQADLSFRFAMEIRNKLIDAYREVMRMSV